MIQIPLEGHRPAGTPVGYTTRALVTVEHDQGADYYGVQITLDAAPMETLDDRDVHRTLTPTEARELAAALWHASEEAER